MFRPTYSTMLGMRPSQATALAMSEKRGRRFPLSGGFHARRGRHARISWVVMPPFQLEA